MSFKFLGRIKFWLKSV